MIGWLYRVLVGRFCDCSHFWEIKKEIPVQYESARTTRYHLQCKHCGDIKFKESGE